MSEESRKRLEETHARVRASMTKEQLAVSDMVASLVEQEAADLDRRLDVENELRKWAKKLCGFSLDITEIERLRSEVQSTRNGSVFVFSASRGAVTLYKTAFGTVDTIPNYIGTLERTVIDITNNSQFTPLTFLGLIKLAFKRLFKRSR